jgi:hypothetical protein
MSHTGGDASAGTVLARDMPGSQVTIAYSNYLQDNASRRFLVSSTSRSDAIHTVIDNGGEGGAALTYAHPDGTTLTSSMVANRITASAVGPDRWLVTVEYSVSRYTGIPPAMTTLMNSKVSFQGTQVWCDPASFARGLPWGQDGRTFLYPRSELDNGLLTDAKRPPAPYIYNRPILSIQVPFSQGNNPMAAALRNVGRTTGGTINGVNFGHGELRYDGSDTTSTTGGGSGYGGLRFTGTDNYSASPGGFYSQRIFFDDALGCWQADNTTPMHPT